MDLLSIPSDVLAHMVALVEAIRSRCDAGSDRRLEPAREPGSAEAAAGQ